MDDNKVFKAEDVEKLLNELFEDVLKEVKGISTVKIENLTSVTNQDARLVSVKGADMGSFKRAGGAFLGKETNITHIDLPNGEYINIDEFVAALKLYFQKPENKKRLFFVESDEWKNKNRKVDPSKLDELKKITKDSSRIVLEKIESINTQDARVVSANIPGDSLTYDKKIGGAFLGSSSGNLKKGYPSQILPLDDSPYVYKEDVIKSLEKIFKAYKETINKFWFAVIPVLGQVTGGQVDATVEQIVPQDEEIPVYEVVVENIYSDGMVIGDVLSIPDGQKFTNDSWGNPSIGEIGNKYTQTSIYTVNGFNVINTQNGQYYTCFEKGKSINEFISNLKAQNKISEGNYTVRYHTNEGNTFTQVGSSNDIGWFEYDENNYPVSSKFPIGTQTKKVQTGVKTVQKQQIEYITYEYETENINEEISTLIMTDENGNMLTLRSKDGNTFKLDEDIVLFDENGNEHKCIVEKTDKKLRIKAIIPFVIPVIKKKNADENDKGSEEKEGGKKK